MQVLTKVRTRKGMNEQITLQAFTSQAKLGSRYFVTGLIISCDNTNNYFYHHSCFQQLQNIVKFFPETNEELISLYLCSYRLITRSQVGTYKSYRSSFKISTTGTVSNEFATTKRCSSQGCERSNRVLLATAWADSGYY